MAPLVLRFGQYVNPSSNQPFNPATCVCVCVSRSRAANHFFCFWLVTGQPKQLIEVIFLALVWPSSWLDQLHGWPLANATNWSCALCYWKVITSNPLCLCLAVDRPSGLCLGGGVLATQVLNGVKLKVRCSCCQLMSVVVAVVVVVVVLLAPRILSDKSEV